MKFSHSFFVIIFLLAGCSHDSLNAPKISDFKNDISVKNLGLMLIDLPYGLNSMEQSRDEVKEIFIVVHGGNSEGYEWIYPLKKIDTKLRHMYFYRWPDKNCFQNSAESLKNEIMEILNEDDSIKKIILMGHSYGGILVTHLLKNWNLATSIEVHVVASPLLGTPMLNSMCGYEPISAIPKNSVLYEWRTQHQLDNVYKDFNEDPQRIELKESFVTTLPETYKGNRLGHNWSISWVADKAF
tara:strand:- start:222 stop:944 length:723 start_codon:yes stop_codon:yes gene_type:complete